MCVLLKAQRKRNHTTANRRLNKSELHRFRNDCQRKNENEKPGRDYQLTNVPDVCGNALLAKRKSVLYIRDAIQRSPRCRLLLIARPIYKVAAFSIFVPPPAHRKFPSQSQHRRRFHLNFALTFGQYDPSVYFILFYFYEMRSNFHCSRL